jgi:phosphatidylglycerophosphatase A
MPKISFRKFIIVTISTFFYVGYLPFIPGTFGSLAGLLLVYLIKGNIIFYVLVTLALLNLGFLVTTEAEEILGRKDARPIVIDEVCGMLIAFLFVPCDIQLVIIGFFIFRLLDTVKPPPSDRLERLKGAIGVMSDDIVAGIYTNIILQVVLRLATFRIS